MLCPLVHKGKVFCWCWFYSVMYSWWEALLLRLLHRLGRLRKSELSLPDKKTKVKTILCSPSTTYVMYVSLVKIF